MALFFSASLFRDQRKRIVQISALVLFVGFFVYSFTLFVYYVFVFAPVEAARLASLNRYMATYMIFEWMFLFAVGMCLTEVGDTKTPGIVCCMVLVPILNIPGWRDLFQSCEPIRNLSMTRFDVMDQVVAPYLVENKKFSIISNSAHFDHYTAVTRWQSHYYDSQWRISANGVENQSGRRYSDASIMNLLKNTDYCYIAALNDAFIQTYGKYFEGDIEFAALYKCDGTKFRKLPLKQFIFDFQKTSLLRSQQRNALVSPSLKSHRLNVKVNSGGEVKIFPLPKLVPLHMGKVSKVVVFFADIRGDGKWEFRDKSNKLHGSGSMCEIEDQLVVTVDNVADFNFTFTVRTAKDQQCVFSISRLEVYYDNSNSSAPASAHELCDQHICTI